MILFYKPVFSREQFSFICFKKNENIFRPLGHFVLSELVHHGEHQETSTSHRSTSGDGNDGGSVGTVVQDIFTFLSIFMNTFNTEGILHSLQCCCLVISDFTN